MNVLFFGSTTDSVIVLEKLVSLKTITISCVITQPPRPVGRKQIITSTPSEIFAKGKNIPVLSFPSSVEKPWIFTNEQTVIDTLEPFQADLLISASYGQKIPTKTIQEARFGGLNVHPSLLPRWRGADPVPWAILSGDHQTGVTVVTLSEKFDEGKIIAQKKINITDNDFSDPLRTKLFAIGADLLGEVLPDYVAGSLKGHPQAKTDGPVSKRLTREHGFELWTSLQLAQKDQEEAQRIDRKYRAFTPWPGVWTTVNNKRLKILTCHVSSDSCLVIDTVQLEGKNPVSFTQYRQAYS